MKSMTGFANFTTTLEIGSFSWEIRAVNQRYLELNFRLPEAFRNLEPELRAACKQQIARGKLEIQLSYQATSSQDEIQINQPKLEQLSQAICQIQQQLPEATQVNPLEFLTWPGMINESQIALETAQPGLVTSFNQALELLNQHRAREGAQLKAILLERCEAILQQIEPINAWMPEILQAQQQKLQQRVQDLTSSELEPQRLAAEIAMLAQRADVTEEIDRLKAHILEVKSVINSSGSLGRRLDFLMQELNREANTLGSKAIDLRLSNISIELKVLIEQMREQVQNIE